MYIHLLLTSLIQIGSQEIDYGSHISFPKLVEHDDVINTVDELRLKASLDLFHDPGFHLLIILFRIPCGSKSQVLGIYDPLGACIGGHDQYGILEAHLPAFGISDMAIVQHLEQNIEHVRMCFLNLIKQHYRIRVPADLLTELAALFESHITRRRANHLGHRMSLHIL